MPLKDACVTLQRHGNLEVRVEKGHLNNWQRQLSRKWQIIELPTDDVGGKVEDENRDENPSLLTDISIASCTICIERPRLYV